MQRRKPRTRVRQQIEAVRLPGDALAAELRQRRIGQRGIAPQSGVARAVVGREKGVEFRAQQAAHPFGKDSRQHE